MKQVEGAKIEINSNIILITKGTASLTISKESQFWKKKENRTVLYELYPELKNMLRDD